MVATARFPRVPGSLRHMLDLSLAHYYISQASTCYQPYIDVLQDAKFHVSLSSYG